MLYRITGTVEHGEHLGRKLGYPTANLNRVEYVRQKMQVPFGVYAGTAMIEGDTTEHKAAIVIGPLDVQGLPKIEAHLLGYRGDLYGKKLTLQLLHFIREFRKFESEEALIRQIGEDMKEILHYLS